MLFFFHVGALRYQLFYTNYKNKTSLFYFFYISLCTICLIAFCQAMFFGIFKINSRVGFRNIYLFIFFFEADDARILYYLS